MQTGARDKTQKPIHVAVRTKDEYLVLKERTQAISDDTRKQIDANDHVVSRIEQTGRIFVTR